MERKLAMGGTIAWLHVGDLHLGAGDGWQSLTRLEAIVAQANEFDDEIDLVFLPGDNADGGEPEQYQAMMRALAPLRRPWRTIPGDHDVQPGHLDAYHAAIPADRRPEAETIAGHRCIFLDIVSAGSGGPDFRLSMHHRARLARELTTAEALGQPALVFMHAYPGDLAADGPEIAGIIADGGARFVDTGHTHYNELLNDGRVVYGATRSTGQIEEDGGAPGYALVCVHEGVPSWRFRSLGTSGPALQIISPADLRMVTRVTDPRQIPRPGATVDVVVRAFGTVQGPVRLALDDRDVGTMTHEAPGSWRAMVAIGDAGLHRVTVRNDTAFDEIEVLVRDGDALPKRRPPVALGQNCHAIGAWPRAGILGTRLGPNDNGSRW